MVDGAVEALVNARTEDVLGLELEFGIRPRQGGDDPRVGEPLFGIEDLQGWVSTERAGRGVGQ